MRWSRFYHQRQSSEAPYETVAQRRLFPLTPAKLITQAGFNTGILIQGRPSRGRSVFIHVRRVITESLP